MLNVNSFADKVTPCIMFTYKDGFRVRFIFTYENLLINKRTKCDFSFYFIITFFSSPTFYDNLQHKINK